MINKEFDTKFKEKMNSILKQVYSDQWVYSIGGVKIGYRGNGGVVGVHKVSDMLKAKGHDVLGDNGWSILNYFDTNPMVKKYLKKLYEKNNTFVLSNFIQWMEDSKDAILKGDILNELIKLNSNSLYNGFLNEEKARNVVSKSLKSDKWEVSDSFSPGSTEDRRGIDFTITNKDTGKVYNVQAKPLNFYTNSNDSWTVNSYNIKYIVKPYVDYFVFTSHNNDKFIIFKNKKDGIRIVDSNKILFNYKPESKG